MSAALQDTSAGAAYEPKTDDKEERRKPDPQAAAKRLADSRERLRLYMLGGENREEARRRAGLARGAADDGPSGLERLREMPVVGTIVEVIGAWWERHPLQPAFALAKDIVAHKVAPVVRRHPGAVMAGAFAFGIVVVWIRPWRWLRKPAIVSGIASQIGARTLAQVPWELILAGLAAMAHTRDEAPADEGTQAAEAMDKESTEALYEPATAPLMSEQGVPLPDDDASAAPMSRPMPAERERFGQTAFP